MTLTGFHAIEEKVRSISQDRLLPCNAKIYFSKPGPRVKKIISLARESGIECISSDEKQLSVLVQKLPPQERDHRGIVFVSDEKELKSSNIVDFEKWILQPRETSTIVILDGVTDPHNIGAILRSCDQFGADLLIVASRNSTSDLTHNDVIARTSAGAASYIPVATVTNLARTAELLKENGWWLYAADANGTSTVKTKFEKKSAIIMGSEGSGISRLLKEKCDIIVSIPTCGKIDSLNVSVAAGVLLYERHRQSLQ